MKQRTTRYPAAGRRDALALALAAAMALCPKPAAAERLTRIDGQTSGAAVVAIDGVNIVLTNATVATLPLEDIWRIDGVTPVAPAASGAVERVVLDRGDIPVRTAVLKDDVCRFDWAGGNGAGIARSSVRALILAAGADASVRESVGSAMEKTNAADQVVALGKEGAVLTIEGAVKEVGASDIVVRYQDTDRTMSRSKACAVVFGRTGTADRAAGVPPWKVTVAGGAWLEGDTIRLADGVFGIAIGADTLSIPWAAVSRVERVAGKVRFLSRMEPVRATSGAIATLELPWQRDRSAMGRPLRWRGELHEVGLGLHAPADLVFDIPAGMQRFMAVVGLDEEYGRGGDCVVVVKIDDREAFRRRMRGTDQAVPVDIRIENGRQITLRAEAGENLDLGDHVNLYDARLLQ